MPLIPSGPQQVVPAETTWLNEVREFKAAAVPDGGKVLMFTLSNAHQYAIPLNGQLLQAVRQAVSPVIAAGADSLPPNGSRG